MPTLIRGDRLAPSTRAQVLEAFGYRWTVENEQQAREWAGEQTRYAKRGRKYARPQVHDVEWLRLHAFYVNADGRLSDASGCTLCVPAEEVPDPRCACCGWALRPRDSARQVEGTDTLHCAMCSSGHGACCHRAGRGVGTLSL